MTNTNKKGFTLMEMLIVVTIIGILAAIVLPRFITSSGTAKKSAHKAERMTINSQLELFYFVFNTYPNNGASTSQMTNDMWGSTDADGNGMTDYQEYFPEGVPVTCNQSAAWTISMGRITGGDSGTHAGHE